MNCFSLAVASVSLLMPSLTAAFDGPYAPDLWTFTTEAGGFIDKHTADTLVLVGGDSGFGGDTASMVSVAADGFLSFDWEYFTPLSSPGYDPSYYSINSVFHLLSASDGVIKTGFVNVNVDAGDLLGFHINSLDGIFGPGTLTITNFSAPVPGVPVMVPLFALLVRQSRRRYDAHDRG